VAVVEFHLPDIGEGLAEVELVRWYVGVGDQVQENQPIADVESDKAVVTMPAPASGMVTRLCVSEGERVKVGSLMMVVDGHTSAQAVSSEDGGGTAGKADGPSPHPESGRRPADEAIAAAPAARRLANERHIDLRRVTGTGPRGRITVEDVERAAWQAPLAVVDAARREDNVEVVPFRGIRRRIAEAMELSYRTIPHVSGFHEFDAGALVGLHAELKPRAERQGVRLTFLPFIVRATIVALKAQPYLNASLDSANGTILIKKAYHIGVAISAPDGLVVPVLRNADRLGLLDIAREIERVSTAARNRTLVPADLQHGTFTITNVGAQRGWLNTSLIRHPEVAILGIGRIEDRAVVRTGQIVARPIMPLALTFDHRVVDGEQGLGFMLTLRERLEQPHTLLDEEPAW
jgi:pyruvate/2-oxoglutarate dehydrogenase complex dihydrolipoamide acyltransferase (E2) component